MKQTKYFKYICEADSCVGCFAFFPNYDNYGILVTRQINSTKINSYLTHYSLSRMKTLGEPITRKAAEKLLGDRKRFRLYVFGHWSRRKNNGAGLP